MLSDITSLRELQEKLIKIKEMGWIDSRRIHDTGIGKTFEDLLEIPENNLQLPDVGGIEVKSSRSTTKSMVTLITFEPPKEYRNVEWTLESLVENFGRTNSKDEGAPVFHITVYFGKYNNNKQKFALDIRTISRKEMVCVVTKTKFTPINPSLPEDVVVCYPLDEIMRRVSRKLSGCLLVIEAESDKKHGIERFKLKSAKLYAGFSTKNFIELVKRGDIALDIRFGRYPDGRPHNHGTAWRIKKDKIHELYAMEFDMLRDELPEDLKCVPKILDVASKPKDRKITEYLPVVLLLL